MNHIEEIKFKLEKALEIFSSIPDNLSEPITAWEADLIRIFDGGEVYRLHRKTTPEGTETILFNGNKSIDLSTYSEERIIRILSSICMSAYSPIISRIGENPF